MAIQKQLFGSIGRRILCGMAIVAIVPVVIVAGQGYHCARLAVVQEARNKLLAIALGRRARIEDWLSERVADMEVLSRTPCVWMLCHASGDAAADTTSGEVCDCLNSFRRRSAAYDGIALFDASRRKRMATGKVPAREIADPFWDQMRKSPGPVFGPLQRTVHGELVLHGGSALRGSFGATGYVVTRLDLGRAIRPILDDTTGLGQTGEVFLVSRDGILLGSSRHSAHEEARRPKLDSVGLQRALAGDSGVDVYQSACGEEVVGAYMWMPDRQWALVAEMEADEALVWVRRLRLRAAATASATLIAIFFVALWLARTLSSPLALLAEAARRVGRGRTDQPVAVGGASEITEVAHAFNQMMRDLDSSRQALARSAALAAVGELSASIVHEMRNPLSSIKMNLQALQTKVEGDALHKELADIAFAQVDRLERMLTDLLSFGKPLELSVVSGSVLNPLEDALSACEAVAAERQVQFVREFDLCLPPTPVDRERMRQAFVNVLENAVEASPDGSDVEIRVRAQDVPDGNEVIIEIADEGPGIPAEALDNVFKPFFTTKADGTGLGLSNVQKIVELHGGRVEAENQSDGGAVFRVCLPVREEP